MASICSRKVSPWLGLAAALFVSVAAAPAFAYSPEQQQACTPDAMRLCGAYIPDVDRITVCMIQRKAQLSPECRRYFRPDPAPSAAAGQPTNIRPVVRKPVSARPASAKTSSAKISSAKTSSAKAKKPKKPAKPADT
jgi:hypothetical protein